MILITGQRPRRAKKHNWHQVSFSEFAATINHNRYSTFRDDGFFTLPLNIANSTFQSELCTLEHEVRCLDPFADGPKQHVSWSINRNDTRDRSILIVCSLFHLCTRHSSLVSSSKHSSSSSMVDSRICSIHLFCTQKRRWEDRMFIEIHQEADHCQY